MKKIISVFVLCVVLTSSLLMSGCSGSYGQAIDNYEQYYNVRSLSCEKRFSLWSNGYCYDEFKKICKIFEGTETLSAFDTESMNSILIDTFGSDYKIKFSEEGSSRISAQQCEDIQNELIEWGEEIDDALSICQSYGAERIASNRGISVSDTHKFFEILSDMSKRLKDSKVTEGKNVSLKVKVTGEKVEGGSKESTFSIDLYNVGGVWVQYDLFEDALDMFVDAITHTS